MQVGGDRREGTGGRGQVGGDRCLESLSLSWTWGSGTHLSAVELTLKRLKGRRLKTVTLQAFWRVRAARAPSRKSAGSELTNNDKAFERKPPPAQSLESEMRGWGHGRV